MLHRLIHTVLSLWIVYLVWLVIVLPQIAYASAVLRREFKPMPWWLGALLWVLEHTWPYTKVVKLSRALDSWPWRSSFPLRPSYHEQQLELPLTFDHDGDDQGSAP